MQCRIADLRRREVVNVADGNRLGSVEDVLVETGSGRVAALVVPGPCRFLGLFFPGDDYIIRWDAVKRIGDDLILVDVRGDCERCRRPRRPFF
ncbi:MAG: YlmC/YmxH family sporulation protein [Oscillospiraceae bacterium]|jgi:YlmC/YmxH family sporulation protein|nr:YlmC/YmxH family sporulation protein [Oscillospiraceae bacterium]